MALFRLPHWIVQEFGDIGLRQAWFHLSLDGSQTLFALPTDLLRRTARELLLKPLLLATLATAVTAALWRPWPRAGRVVRAAVLCSAAGLGGLGVLRTTEALHLQDHWSLPSDAVLDTDWMLADHRSPDSAALAARLVQARQAAPALDTPRQTPRNLVLIQVESLQNRFVQPQRALATWRQSHTSARRFYTLPGTQWTLGGLLASHCGLPLVPTGWGGRNHFDSQHSPLPGATCLGDVLQRAGFATAFVGGADPAFAGKGTFLRNHGFDRVYGRDDIQRHLAGRPWPTGWWGFEDHITLAFATQVLDGLERSGQPFFLHLLTLDTHGPRGVTSHHCQRPGPASDMQPVFDCSLEALEAFLTGLERRGRLRDSVVVVMGDHPLMAPGWSAQRAAVSEDAGEDVFFAMAVPGREPQQLGAISHFDVPALALQALLGEPDQPLDFALGRTPPLQPSLVERDGRAQLAARLRRPSPAYVSLWQAPGARP